MPIVAMRIVTAQQHPNADRLRLYTAEANGEEVTFVANLTNVYEPGDVVAVARVGTTLRDGLTIAPTKIRGVESFGMGLGKTDSLVGSEVSEPA